MQPIKYPAALQPTTTETMTLPSGRSVSFPEATPTFRRWGGAPVEGTYGKKAILDFDGRPAFAELAILWTLEKAGWQGFWVDCYRRAFRTGYWNSHKSSFLQNRTPYRKRFGISPKHDPGYGMFSAGKMTGSYLPNPRN